METLAAAIACVALAVVISALILSAAIRRLATAVSRSDARVPDADGTESRRPITVSDLPGPPRSESWDGPSDDVEQARLQIQKMAFDAPPLITRGGDARERTSDMDVETISRALPNGAADR